MSTADQSSDVNKEEQTDASPEQAETSAESKAASDGLDARRAAAVGVESDGSAATETAEEPAEEPAQPSDGSGTVDASGAATTHEDAASAEASNEAAVAKAEDDAAEAKSDAASAKPEDDAAEAKSDAASAKPEDDAAEAKSDAASDTTESDAAEANAATSDDSNDSKDSDKDKKSGNHGPKHILKELRALRDLSAKYPEIGPTVAQLAIKIGHRDLGDQVLRMGIDDDSRGTEYYFVAAQVARKEGRAKDVLKHVLSGLDDFAANPPTGDLAGEEKSRLLHLVRVGFAALMFDLGSVDAAPDFTKALAVKLPALEEHYKEDAFYHQLRAQALWFVDKEKSEAAWERAVEVGDAETVWNARGTWYKESKGDLSSAEAAYRKGLKEVSHSALLRHNLAQVLMDRAEPLIEEDAETAAKLLQESEGLLHNARRQAHRGRLRGHIHESLDRVKALKARIPDLTKPPKEGETVKGRVVSIKKYGAFLKLPGGETGLLHNSEIAHEWVEDPNNHVSMGDEVEVKVIKIEDRDGEQGLRVSLSKKALTPKPEGFDENAAKKKRNNKGKRRSGKKNGRRNSGKKKKKDRGHKDETSFTMGELLLAKLEEKKKE